MSARGWPGGAVLAALLATSAGCRDEWPADGAPVVLLVVLDTVRADHTSLCGYGRPTTPALESLARRPASAWSCDARAPGTWTLPSHASFFTGLDVPSHRADDAFVPVGEAKAAGAVSIADLPLSGVAGRWLAMPLAPDEETLAETLRAQGWQTLLISGNPLVSAALGLGQGFEKALVAPHPVVALKAATRELDRRRPAFVVVNLYDAHDPWPGVPAGVGWLPERPGLGYDLRAPTDPWRAFVSGTMPAAERDAFRGHLTDVYDHGIRRADDALGAILALSDTLHWPSRGLRLAVVSDHGEMLGEHGLLQHGQHVWDTTQRVPLVLFDSTRPGRPTLPDGPVSAALVYRFLRDGPAPGGPALGATVLDGPVVTHGMPMWWSAAFPGVSDGRWVAAWDGPRKVTWHEGEVAAYDLATDPDELHPLPPTATERTRVETEGRRLDAVAIPRTLPGDDVTAALRAAGYLE